MTSRTLPAVLLAVSLGTTATVCHARALWEIRHGGTLRICVAGSIQPFYQANGEAFARFLGVQPEIKRLASFDEQFQNDDGVIVQEASYEARFLADGSCDVFPNDLHITAWRKSKMALVPYYTVRKVIIGNRNLRQALKRTQDLAGHTAAVQKGTDYEAWLVQRNAKEFAGNPVAITYAPRAEGMKLVADGKADFTVASSWSGSSTKASAWAPTWIAPGTRSAA